MARPKPTAAAQHGWGVAIRADELRRVLGPTAFAVWQVLLVHRDWQNYSALTTRRMVQLVACDGATNPKRAIEHALKRLRTARLVKYVGVQPMYWQDSLGRKRHKRLHAHEVRGDYKGADCVVPTEARTALMTMNTHGGARAGAGRKPKQPVIKMGVPTEPGIKMGGAEGIKMGGQVSTLYESPSSLCLPSEDKENGGGEAAASLSSLRPAESRVIPFPATDRFSDPALPPFPGMDVLEPASVPSPPKLSADDPEGVWALALVRAYKGAVQSRYSIRSHAFGRGNIATSRYFKGLVEAAHKLMEYGIPPAAWAAFSVDVWKHYGKEKAGAKPPAVQWVFAAKRIDERHGWYKAESSSYTGARVVFNATARELMARYQRMHVAVIQSDRPVVDIVAEHFPDGLFDRLADKARREAQEERKAFKEAAARGDWLWR